MKTKLVIWFLSIYFFADLALAANSVLYYEPQIVTLSGIIKLKTFPGAPGYESVESGDDLDTCFYLFLDQPIDVVESLKDADPNAESEKNLAVIQVAPGSDDNWDKIKSGNHVCVTGCLFHAINGHHHTRVLIHGNQIKGC